mmetsp:Transcript_94570/g.216329  ORF Transcript_94570/g.216329 Transcript_94570/m.216329 type:complete len:192 (+) Transcript_94570:63-638(+)
MSGRESLARLHRCSLQWIRDYDRAQQPPTPDEWAKKLTAAVKPAMLALDKVQLKKLKDIWKQMWDFKKSALAGEHVNAAYIKYILKQVSEESQKMMGRGQGNKTGRKTGLSKRRQAWDKTGEPRTDPRRPRSSRRSPLRRLCRRLCRSRLFPRRAQRLHSWSTRFRCWSQSLCLCHSHRRAPQMVGCFRLP